MHSRLNERRGCDNGILVYVEVTHHHRIHTDETITLQKGAVDDCPKSNVRILFKPAILAMSDMERTRLLDVLLAPISIAPKAPLKVETGAM
ncbi:hypothetical protein D9M68_69030 [compost metagenome]